MKTEAIAAVKTQQRDKSSSLSLVVMAAASSGRDIIFSVWPVEMSAGPAANATTLLKSVALHLTHRPEIHPQINAELFLYSTIRPFDAGCRSASKKMRFIDQSYDEGTLKAQSGRVGASVSDEPEDGEIYDTLDEYSEDELETYGILAVKTTTGNRRY